MLRNSFVFIDGFGPRKEKSLWKNGIEDWDSFLNSPKIPRLSSALKSYADRQIKLAKQSLYSIDSSYFSQKLPSGEQWRLFDFFKEDAVYLDIETTGLKGNDVTVVGLYDGLEYKSMIKGINLDFNHLFSELEKYKLIITFNGDSFDLPILRKLNAVPKIASFDLRHACKRIGLKGGLKEIERTMGFARPQIVDGMHGGDALSLWKIYRATGDKYYLDLLLQYNEEDCANLKPIAEHVCSKLKSALQIQIAR